MSANKGIPETMLVQGYGKQCSMTSTLNLFEFLVSVFYLTFVINTYIYSTINWMYNESHSLRLLGSKLSVAELTHSIQIRLSCKYFQVIFAWYNWYTASLIEGENIVNKGMPMITRGSNRAPGINHALVQRNNGQNKTANW